MRRLTPKKYAIALYESIKEAEAGEMEKKMQAFVLLLARNKVLKKSEKIIQAFIKYYNEQEKIEEVQATTAKPLEASTRHQLVAHLEKVLQKKIELRETIDTSLIGGLTVKFGDNIIDGSLKTRINSLAEKLT